MKGSILSHLNINQLKVFESVYRLRSMTLASQELYLTQSGVSQHIKKLEQEIHIPLFVRNKHELFATPEADALYKACERAFTDITATLDILGRKENKEFEGLVRLGVPTEFGNNVLIPQLAAWAQRHPKVKFDFVYGFGAQLTELLEQGAIDLALIDSLKGHRSLEAKVIRQEDLSLVASVEYMQLKKLSLKGAKDKLSQILALDFVEYEHKESILRMWFQAHYGKRGVSLNVRAWAVNVQGVAACIRSGIGAGVLPNHVIRRLLDEGVELHVFRGAKGSLKNEIFLSWVKAKPHSRVVEDLKKTILSL